MAHRAWSGKCPRCGENRGHGTGHWTSCCNPCIHCASEGKPTDQHIGLACPCKGEKWFRILGGGGLGETNRNKGIIESLSKNLTDEKARGEVYKAERDSVRLDMKEALEGEESRSRHLERVCDDLQDLAHRYRSERDDARRELCDLSRSSGDRNTYHRRHDDRPPRYRSRDRDRYGSRSPLYWSPSPPRRRSRSPAHSSGSYTGRRARSPDTTSTRRLDWRRQYGTRPPRSDPLGSRNRRGLPPSGDNTMGYYHVQPPRANPGSSQPPRANPGNF